MDMTGLAPKIKNNIFKIATILLAIIISMNIYKHQAKQLVSLEQKKEEAMKKDRLLEGISQLERKISSYKNLLVRRNSGLLIESFSNIAKETGVQISGIKPLPEQKFAGYTKLPFELTLNAPNYHAIGKFISKVESYRDVYLADTVDIKSRTETGYLNFTVTVSCVVATN